MKQQHTELMLREKVLVRRLASKEQEIQEYAGQLSEMKAAQTPGAVALRQALLDPAVNLLLQRLRQELMSTRTRLEETQNELSAWKFTPDSNTGKRLMAKCRLLYQENEELGRMISSGRLAKLEGDLALQKSFSEEVKKSQSEMDEFLQDLDEDVEGMQSTIYYLQQELRKAKEAAISLEHQNNVLRTGGGCEREQGSRSADDSRVTNGIKEVASVGRGGEVRVIKQEEERTNGVKEEWAGDSIIGKRDEELSTDSSGLVLKITAEDEMGDDRSETDDATEDCVEERTNNSVLNNNSPAPRKRTISEESDDVPLSKKIKAEPSERPAVHYNNDEESVLVNGDNSTVVNSASA